MLEDLETIRTSVRLFLNETTASFWADATINLMINEGMEEIAHETGCLRTWKTYTVVADDIFDSRELRMDSDFIAIDEGKVYYNDKSLKRTTQHKLASFDRSWRDRTGTPTAYYIRGDMMGFNRKITAGDTVKFYQIERGATLSGSVVPFNGDYRLINFRKLIRDYAVSQCWYMKSEDQKGDRFFMRYLAGLENMKFLLGIDNDDSMSIVPHESLTRNIRKRSTDALEMT